MGLDILIEQCPEHGIVTYDLGEHRTTFLDREAVLVRYPSLTRLQSYFADSIWTVDELPELRAQLLAFIERVRLDGNLTSKLRRFLALVDHGIRMQRPVVAEAD